VSREQHGLASVRGLVADLTAPPNATLRSDGGPELGRRPTTYTCRCGFRSTDYDGVVGHIAIERERAHMPRRLTTIPAVGSVGSASGIEVASTPHGDADDAVEIRVIVPDGSPGHFRRHVVLVRRSALPFLIEELEAHRLDRG
jgi:hypothetical protein